MGGKRKGESSVKSRAPYRQGKRLRPGQVRGVEDPLSLHRQKGTPPFHSRLGNRASLEGNPAQITFPELPPGPSPVMGFYTEVGQWAYTTPQPLAMNNDFVEFTISAPCFPFFTFWPEGTLGTRTVIPLLPHRLPRHVDRGPATCWGPLLAHKKNRSLQCSCWRPFQLQKHSSGL